ncbi:MAG: T9SS type A sorting domain-containing protein [Bacteroidetes bacterium]|nr:T9SS type A sorting domain-containing protein [Bacteroidota bacterium]
MKTTLLLCSIMLCLVLSSTAQITITRDDFTNLNGINVVQIQDTSNFTNISPGNPGANQTWNLSAIGKDVQDTMRFISPAGVGCSSSFPSATYAVVFPNFDGYQYVSITSSSLDVLGMCGVFMPPDIMIVPYSPAYTKMTFPATFNTTFSGKTKQIMQFGITPPPPDSARLISTITYSSLVDGWGNVTTPIGTYNSLRVKATETKVDSMFYLLAGNWMYAGLPPTTTITTTYEWWVKKNFPVATLVLNSNGQIKSATYSVVSTVGIEKPTPEVLQSAIIPNLVSHSFTIINNNVEARKFTLIDILGNKVFDQEITDQQMQFSTAKLSKGMYLYIIRNAKDESVSSGKLIIE